MQPVLLPRVSIIVGRARNGVIGRDNAIPWHLPEDLKHFKATTMGCPIIMGRKTFESVGRPLTGRRNIVVSSNASWAVPGTEHAQTLSDAIVLCADSAEVFVIGGARLYREALDRASRLIITEIDLAPAGDVLFPAIDARHWQVENRRAQVSSSGIGYEIIEYRRVQSS